MNYDTIPKIQLPLFIYGEPIENILEVLPAVWNAAESLAAPDTTTRNQAINAILELGVQRVSPLIAYLLVTRLDDPEISIRRRVIYVLGDLLMDETSRKDAPDDVRKTIIHALQRLNEDTAFGLLEVAVLDPKIEKFLFQLFNHCSTAGKYLGEILSQRKYSVPIRQKAIYFVGQVGYTEVLPVLERLYNRLEARQNDQYSMSFAPSAISPDENILPVLRIAINRLTA
jgi:HEAT repeat protein